MLAQCRVDLEACDADRKTGGRTHTHNGLVRCYGPGVGLGPRIPILDLQALYDPLEVVELPPVIMRRTHLKPTCSGTDEHGVEFNRRCQRKDTHERQRLPAAHQIADYGPHLRPAERRFTSLPSPVRLSRRVTNETNTEGTF